MGDDSPRARPTNAKPARLTLTDMRSRGEPIGPPIFSAESQGASRHVVEASDVVRGLGLRNDLAERVTRLVQENAPTSGGSFQYTRAHANRLLLSDFLRTQTLNADTRQEIERRALTFWRRPGGATMRHVIKAEVFYGDNLSKAGAHKYVSRKPDGKGGWTYVYATRKGGSSGGKEAKIKEGSELEDGDYNGLRYKRKVHKIEHDDATGDTHFHVSGSHDKSGSFKPEGSSEKTHRYTVHADGSMSSGDIKLGNYAHEGKLAPKHDYRDPKAKYISVEKKGDGFEVQEHPTKMAAHAYGKRKREEGADINVHSKADAEKHGLDPRDKEQPKKEAPKAEEKPKAPKFTHVTLEVGEGGKPHVVGHESEEAANKYAKEKGDHVPVLPHDVAVTHGLKPVPHLRVAKSVLFIPASLQK